jgi:hypothetical protein
MEFTPLLVGAAVGGGAGLVDREEAKLAHSQLIYRVGGLVASLWAQHKGIGPANVAPAAVSAFAANTASRATALFLKGELHEFGMTAHPPRLALPTAAGATSRPGLASPTAAGDVWVRQSRTPEVQHLTNTTQAGMAGCPCGQKH